MLGGLTAREFCSVRGVLVVACICALTAALASRYSLDTYEGPATQSSVSQAQHNSGAKRLDGDALTWVPPASDTSILEVPSFYPRIAPAGLPQPRLEFDQSLYNRPPPASQSL